MSYFRLYGEREPPGVTRYIVIVVICGERVSQMTKVYDDIEAVTHLLEEVSYVP